MSDELKKVYVVTSGQYSDYAICGVYASEADAQTFMRAFPREYSGYNDVKEFEVGKYLSNVSQGLKPYKVLIGKETGEIYSCDQDDDIPECEESIIIERLKSETLVGWLDGDVKDRLIKEPALYCSVWGTDKEHANKITTELRRIELANEKGA